MGRYIAMKNHTPSLRRSGTPKLQILRETKIHFQAFMSEYLEEEDFPLRRKSSLLPPVSLKRMMIRWEFPNLMILHHHLTLEEEKVDNLTPSQNLDLEESQDEEDLPIILHAENIDRKSGKNAPFFISLLINDFTLHNCMLDSGASTNIMPLRVMQQLGLEIS
jgi:hypothetical protein